MGVAMKCCGWSLYHDYHRLTYAGTGNSGHLRPSFNKHLYSSFSCALVVLCSAHICATVFRPCNQDLNIEWNTLWLTYRGKRLWNQQGLDFKRPITCIIALESAGTGLLSIVLRLLSSLCHLTEGLGSPAAWHSRLMGSPTLIRTGPAGVTTALGDSKNEIRQKYKNRLLRWSNKSIWT